MWNYSQDEEKCKPSQEQLRSWLFFYKKKNNFKIKNKFKISWFSFAIKKRNKQTLCSSKSKLFNKTGSMDGADYLLIQLGAPVRTVIVSCERDLVSIWLLKFHGWKKFRCSSRKIHNQSLEEGLLIHDLRLLEKTKRSSGIDGPSICDSSILAATLFSGYHSSYWSYGW